MLAENGELDVSHRTHASVSQPGNTAQPEIVCPAEAGSSSSQPGETLAKTLSDINVNMGTMASLLQTIAARQDAKPQKKRRHSPTIFRAPTPSLKTTTTRRLVNEGVRKTN